MAFTNDHSMQVAPMRLRERMLFSQPAIIPSALWGTQSACE